MCSERFIIGVGIVGGKRAFFGLITGCQEILKLIKNYRKILGKKFVKTNCVLYSVA